MVLRGFSKWSGISLELSILIYTVSLKIQKHSSSFNIKTFSSRSSSINTLIFDKVRSKALVKRLIPIPYENFDNFSQETKHQLSHLHNQGSGNSSDPRVDVPSENLPHHPKGHILGIGQSENIGTFSQETQDLGQYSKNSSNLWSFLVPQTIPHWL